IGMRFLVVNFIQEQAFLFQFVDDERVRLKDLATLKLRNFVCKAAGITEWRENLKLIFRWSCRISGECDLVIFLSMTRRYMDTSRSLLQSYKITNKNWREFGRKRTPATKPKGAISHRC